MSRKFMGRVAGGSPSAQIPKSNAWSWNVIQDHAIGRVKCMQDTLIHATQLKSAGLIAVPTASYSGAKFQDWKNERGSGFVRAHRAIFATNIGGVNLVDAAIAPHVGGFGKCCGLLRLKPILCYQLQT
jgi:hypothetical protein